VGSGVDSGRDFSAVTTDLESVTVSRVDRDTGTVTATAAGVHANRLRPASRAEGVSESGEVPVARLTWHVRSDQPALTAALPGGPRKGDELLDAAGARWLVDAVTGVKGGEPYVCETVRLQGT
jgi:hypothetical protein